MHVLRAVGLVLAGVLLAASTSWGGAAAHKRALLIGISDYGHFPHARSLYPSPLHCKNDVMAIRKLLMAGRFGSDWKVTALTTPQETTRASILAALDRLVQETQAGDVVLLQYSGHGNKTEDPSDPTGWDETIVPADYQTTDTDFTHTNEITSKEIGARLAALRAKHAANVTLLFDCCHSGRISRGDTVLRGISFEEFYEKLHPGRPLPHVGAATRGGISDVAAGSAVLRDADRDNYVVLSACEQFQTAAEDEALHMGRLTASLVRALKTAGPTTTYRQLYERICADFTAHYTDHDQNPQIAGAIDNVFLSGTAIAPQEYVPARLDPASGRLALTEGEVMGVTVGSKYALYPIGTSDFKAAKPLAAATVDGVDTGSAMLKLDGGVDPAIFKSGAQAVETEHCWGDQRLKLDRDSIAALGAEGTTILDALKPLKLVELVPSSGHPQVAIQPTAVASRGEGTLQLVRADASNQPIEQLATGPALADRLWDALKREAQFRLVKRLQSNSDEYCVQARILRMTVKDSGRRDRRGNPIYAPDGTLPYRAGEPLQVGDWVCIQVKNTGTANVHVAVLDIGSDGTVTPLWPGRNTTQDENVLPLQEENNWVYLWNTQAPSDSAGNHYLIHVTSPDAGEMLKVIATRDYIPFYKFATEKGADRGESSPLADLLGSTVDDGTRGMGGQDDEPDADWSTLTIPVVVKAKR